MNVTELEGAVLALVGMSPEGATAYWVKEVMRRSPTRIWSGSAGAIYPIFERMEKRSLLRGRGESDGKRERTVYTLTPSGERAMQNWLGDPDRAADVGTDPLRLRLAFVEFLPPARLKGFLAAVADSLEKSMKRPDMVSDQTAAIHEIWARKRCEAFAEVRALLEAEIS